MLFRSANTNNADTAIKNETKEAGETEGNENEENEKNETKSKVTPVSITETKGTIAVKTKTADNLLAAFNGETTASAKYAAYSKKAEQEGYHQVALLFKAASASEKIHANNHKAVLEESGIKTLAINPEYTVKSTKENLDDAINGETYEVTTMYPEFLKEANESGDQLAMISLNYAYKTEKKHKILYETALAALQNNTVKSLPSVFYVPVLDRKSVV